MLLLLSLIVTALSTLSIDQGPASTVTIPEVCSTRQLSKPQFSKFYCPFKYSYTSIMSMPYTLTIASDGKVELRYIARDVMNVSSYYIDEIIDSSLMSFPELPFLAILAYKEVGSFHTNSTAFFNNTNAEELGSIIYLMTVKDKYSGEIIAYAECHAELSTQFPNIPHGKEKHNRTTYISIRNENATLPKAGTIYKNMFILAVIAVIISNALLLWTYKRKNSQKVEVITRNNYIGSPDNSTPLKFEKDQNYMPLVKVNSLGKPSTSSNFQNIINIFKQGKDFKLTMDKVDDKTTVLTLRVKVNNSTDTDELLKAFPNDNTVNTNGTGNSIEHKYSHLSSYKFNNDEFYGNFEEHKNIGSGAFSSVYRAMSKLDKRIYAIKVIRVYAKKFDIDLSINNSKEIVIDERDLNEFRLLASLEYHENIVKRYYNWIANGWIMPQDVVKEDESSQSQSMSLTSQSQVQSQVEVIKNADEKLSICILMDYYELSLYSYLTSRKKVNMSESIKMFEGLVKGVEFLHLNKIMHRDIKPQNIFIKNGTAVIGDLGLSRKVCVDEKEQQTMSKSRSSSTSSSDEFTCGIGSYRYASPEQITSKEYNEKTDIFPCGLILIELFYMFTTSCEQSSVFGNLRKGVLDDCMKKELGEDASSLVEKMTTLDYKQRISSSAILKSVEFMRMKAKCSGDSV